MFALTPPSNGHDVPSCPLDLPVSVTWPDTACILHVSVMAQRFMFLPHYNSKIAICVSFFNSHILPYLSSERSFSHSLATPLARQDYKGNLQEDQDKDSNHVYEKHKRQMVPAETIVELSRMHFIREGGEVHYYTRWQRNSSFSNALYYLILWDDHPWGGS